MPANLDILSGSGPPRAWIHSNLPIFAADSEHCFRGAAIEFAMKPFKKLGRCGRRKRIGRCHPVDLGLNADMSRGLNLQVATTFILIELTCQCPLNIARTCVVALD